MLRKRICSCAKGKTGERQAAHHLIALGFEGARRTEQHQGAGSIGDVMAPTLPHLSIEVKVGRQCGFGAWLCATVLKAEADCRHLFPVVLWRAQGERTWLLSFKEDDILWTLSRGEDQAVTLRRLNVVQGPATLIPQLTWTPKEKA
jgi:hypothetical protein